LLTDSAKEFLISKGSNLDYGARPLRRAIESRVEDPLSEELLKGTFDGKNTIVVDVVRDSDGKVARLDFQGEHRESDTPPQVAESSAS
jgi:ATP-dependent Clp protease ATP-binding subunit ClpC